MFESTYGEVYKTYSATADLQCRSHFGASLQAVISLLNGLGWRRETEWQVDLSERSQTNSTAYAVLSSRETMRLAVWVLGIFSAGTLPTP